MKLSILILTIPERSEMLVKLIGELTRQIYHANCNPNDIEVLNNPYNGSKGDKRNALMFKAKGDYVCFVDDDDEVSSDYIDQLLVGIDKGVDCCSLKGIITFDNETPEIFEHSIKYKEYKTTDNDIMYERYPNHLNCIKSSIAKQFKFPEINFGEDTDWATQIFNSGLINTEHYIDKVLYHYKYVTHK